MSVYSYQKKSRTHYYYQFSYKNKIYKRKGFLTRTMADRAESKRKAELIEKRHGIYDKYNDPTFKDFTQKYLERLHIRSKTRYSYSIQHLNESFGDKRLSEITVDDIEQFKNKRLKNVSKSTFNRDRDTLNSIFEYAIKWNNAVSNPVKQINKLEEPPARIRFLTVDEIQKLLNISPLWLKNIVICAINTGMRSGEILNLKWGHVHLEYELKPYIELHKTKKRVKNRIKILETIPLNRNMVNLLKSIKKESDYVFLNRYGKPIKRIERSLKYYLRKIDIKDFRFHDLRHTFASHFLMRGGSMKVLKDLLRVSSMNVVERYGHLAQEHHHNQIENLDGDFS